MSDDDAAQKETISMSMLTRISSLLRSTPGAVNPLPETRLLGPHVILRMGQPEDWKHWRAMREISRDFLVPWEPMWPSNALAYSFFCGVLRRQWREWRQGKAYAFSIFLRKGDDGGEGPLIGGIALNDVMRGIAQKGTLGYWIGLPFARQGYMAEAAGLVCGFAFGKLRLHRIEASCLPHNEPSRKLLMRLGFAEEGFARAYLRINGRWEDHVLWGKVRPDA